MIRKSEPQDFDKILVIINDGAEAYRGIIPEDRWHEPYMSGEELRTQLDEGVEFWCYVIDSEFVGVMGIQYKNEVTMIRHAYIRTVERGKGIGSKLLAHLITISKTPILIGTWAAASWAIGFYEKHGFRLLPEADKNALLRKYWNIPQRQVETSVVLASEDFT